MKTTTFFVLALLPFFMYGQNWSPVSQGYTYNFRHPDSLLISHCIRIDSVKTEGTDSLFYLNKVLHKCPECLPFKGINRFLRNRSQFLQDVVRKTGDGKYLFEGKQRFVLLSDPAPGSNWIFDTTANITANYTGIQLEPVFGTPDSVKTFLLSNGLRIKLSKSFGLLLFPNEESDGEMELLGIQEKKAGALLPGYRDFFDFHPGDVFQQKESSSDGNTQHYKKAKYTVLTRKDVGDRIEYTFRCNVDSSYHAGYANGGPFYATYTTRAVFSPDTISWLNDRPYQIVESIETDFQNCLSPIRYLDLPGFGPTKILGGYRRIDEIYQGLLWPFPNASSDTLQAALFGEPYFSFENGFAVGLGETDYRYLRGDDYLYRETIGYVKNGDTTGIIYPDLPSDIEGSVVLVLKQNPSTYLVHCNVTISNGQTGTLEVFDISGKRWYEKTVKPSDSHFIDINMNAASPGMYIVRLKAGRQSVSKRLIVFPWQR